MRKLLPTLAIAAVAALTASPEALADRGRGRGQGNGNGHRTEQNYRRPDRNNHNNNKGSHTKPDRDNKNHGNNSGHRPGNNGHNNNHNGRRPPQSHATPPRNHGNHGHGYAKPRPPHHATPPRRPYMPAHHHWRPACRPAHWRPTPSAPRISTILGIALGSVINHSLDILLRDGYTVSGYGNTAVYLTSTPMLGYTWPNATLYYENGGLGGSDFVYSTTRNDMSRYNALYNRLCARYGAPVSVQSSPSVTSATWYGYDRGFVTISYYPGYADDGSWRYFTTLEIGG